LSTAPEPAPPVLTTIEASVAHLVLNRPQARNAITVALAAGLAGALREAAARARVIVIRGAGGHFCAGGDFGEVSRPGDRPRCARCSRRSAPPAS
jgi:enoyl-CoA hydratase/carnithine racemase